MKQKSKMEYAKNEVTRDRIVRRAEATADCLQRLSEASYEFGSLIDIESSFTRITSSDHRVRTIDLPFQNHAQLRLRVHHVIIRSI